MKVKVISAVRKTFWYAKHINKTFEVNISKLSYAPNRYELILPNEKLLSFIRFEDSEVINN